MNLARSVLGLPAEPTDQFGSLDETTATQVMIAIAAVVGAPLFEELLFRGVVLHAMLVWGEAAAILGSSLLFGLTHLNPELGLDQNVLLLVSTTTTGCVLAWVARRGRAARTRDGGPRGVQPPGRGAALLQGAATVARREWRTLPSGQAGRRWTTSPTAKVRRGPSSVWTTRWPSSVTSTAVPSTSSAPRSTRTAPPQGG